MNNNFFKLFDINSSYDVELDKLSQKYKELQKKYHPDNFANDTTENKNQALINSSLVNDAYFTLSNPLKRALYILKLNDFELDLVHSTKFSPMFLMKQIEVREAIDESYESEDIDELFDIEQELKREFSILDKQCSVKLANKQYADNETTEIIKQMSFYSKLLEFVATKIDDLD